MHEKPAEIPEPGNDEIRAIARGLPVLTIRPEDIPGFKPSTSDDYSQSEVLARMRAIENLTIKFNPSWKVPLSYWETPARTRSGFLGGYILDNKPQCFLFIRPSRQLSSIHDLSNITGLDIKELKASPFLQSAIHAIYAWHEAGHIKAAVEQQIFKNNFESELYAERFSLGKVARYDGSREAIRHHLLARALAGFLDQPPDYWLAPALSQQFNQAASGTTDTWNSYAELRLRSVASITGNSLKEVPSEPVHQALRFWKDGQSFRIGDQRLSLMVQSFDEIRNGKNYADSGRTKRKMLLALPEILQSPLIDSFTKAVGDQIVEAVHTFCPRISAEMATPKRSLLGWLFS